MTHAELQALLRDGIGLDLDLIGANGLRSALRARAEATGAPDPATYLRHLVRTSGEFDALLSSLVVPETWFFREAGAFEVLREYVVGERAGAARGVPVRVLCAACCTGEEAYSIAIALLEAGLPPGSFRIVASDVCRAFLDTARAAFYRPHSFRGRGAESLVPYLHAEPGGFRVSARVREHVDFAQGNVVEPGFASGQGTYPVVFCRNLLIYLHAAAREQVFGTLERLVAPGGLLFVGHAESFSRPGFGLVTHAHAFAYRRTSRATSVAIPAPVPASGLHGAVAPNRPLQGAGPATLERQESGREGSGTSPFCWRTRGVAGDRSCPRLPAAIHCRNCDDFAAAGRQLLERAPPDGYEDEWRRILATPKETLRPDEQTVLIFRVGAEWLALPLRVCQRVTGARPAHRLPHARPKVSGLVNVLGELHLAVRLDRVLGLAAPAPPDSAAAALAARLLLVAHDGDAWVFAADEVLAPARVAPSQLEPFPAAPAQSPAAHCRGLFRWQGKRVGLLDEGLLFSALKRSLA